MNVWAPAEPELSPPKWWSSNGWAAPEPGVAPPPALALPGPTGESNSLTLHPRAPVLCLGPGAQAARGQAQAVRALGGVAQQATGAVTPDDLTGVTELSAVLWWGDADTARALSRALARRDGPLVPLITGHPDVAHVMGERQVCVDTTASGGNAALLSAGG